jgi:hypothetical protein
MPRITKRRVDNLEPGQTIWDADVKRFGVRRQKSNKVFVVKYGVFYNCLLFSQLKHAWENSCSAHPNCCYRGQSLA